MNNIIIGSRLALAMATAKHSPVGPQFAIRSKEKHKADTNMAKRCESIKEQSRRLLDKIKAQDIALAYEASKLRGSPAMAKKGRMATVVNEMMKQQAATHLKLEGMLDEVMGLIQGERKSRI